MSFTAAIVKKIAPRISDERAKVLAGLFNTQLPKNKITSPRAVAMFLANTLAETGGWTMLEENLNYSAERLRQVWPQRFRTMAEARRYANNPEKLANLVYNRYGNEKIPGGGWKYRGRGFMMTTFYVNYLALEKATGLPVTRQPELLLRLDTALEAAIFYWNAHNLTPLAEANKLLEVRKKINGGTNGLSEVASYYKKVLPIVADLDLKKEIVKTVTTVGGAGGGAVVTTTVATHQDYRWIIPVAVVSVIGVGVAVYRLQKARKKDVERTLADVDKLVAAHPQGLADISGERHYGGGGDWRMGHS
jgi:putative chitinase